MCAHSIATALAWRALFSARIGVMLSAGQVVRGAARLSAFPGKGPRISLGAWVHRSRQAGSDLKLCLVIE